MKLRKAELWAILLTVIFLALTAGWQLGTRRRAPSFRVNASAQTRASERALPAAEERAIVDLNTAGVEELKTLSGIGDALAQRIVAYREEHGPFQSVEDIKKVSGIGEKTYEANRERLTVGTEGEDG